MNYQYEITTELIDANGDVTDVEFYDVSRQSIIDIVNYIRMNSPIYGECESGKLIPVKLAIGVVKYECDSDGVELDRFYHYAEGMHLPAHSEIPKRIHAIIDGALQEQLKKHGPAKGII